MLAAPDFSPQSHTQVIRERYTISELTRRPNRSENRSRVQVPMLTIYIDADACPVKEEVYRVARRYEMRVVVAANAPLRVPATARVELIVCPGFGAVDDWIASQ